MIKFSVVIPLYNKEEDIIQTINSVLEQSYVADEVIVVDDGSTDGSVELVQKHFEDRVLVVQQKNAGETAARNKGISVVKNEYVALLDADDLWEKSFLEEIKYLIEDYPEAAFYSTASKSINEEGVMIKNRVEFSSGFIGLIENFSQTFSRNYGLINSSSVCIRKSFFDKGIIFPMGEKRGGDLCYWLQLSLEGKLAFSAKALSVYKLDASNRSSVIHQEGIVPCPLKWFYKNKKSLKENKYYKSIRHFIYSNILITVYGGFALSNNRLSIDAVVKEMKQNNDGFYFLLYPAYFMPIGFLEFIKKIRRKMR